MIYFIVFFAIVFFIWLRIDIHKYNKKLQNLKDRHNNMWAEINKSETDWHYQKPPVFVPPPPVIKKVDSGSQIPQNKSGSKFTLIKGGKK